MSLTLDPAESAQSSSNGSVVTHTINSTSSERIAFKVKCSNNEMYRVKPVYGFIDAGKSGKLEVLRLIGAPKEDKLVIQWAEVPADEVDPVGPFKAGAQSGEVTLPLKAT